MQPLHSWEVTLCDFTEEPQVPKLGNEPARVLMSYAMQQELSWHLLHPSLGSHFLLKNVLCSL